MACGSGADTSLGNVSFVKESTWGEVPATTDMQRIRVTSSTVGPNKTQAGPEEIRSDRQKPDIVEQAQSAGGDLSFMWSYGNADALIAGAMGSAWSGVADWNGTTDSSVAFSNSGATIVSTGIEAEFEVGDVIRVRNAEEITNDGFYTVTVVAANTLTVHPAPTTDDAADATVDIDTDRLGMGSTCHSYAIEHHYSDLSTSGEYVINRGLVPGGWSMRINAEGFIEGTINFLGKDVDSGSAEYTTGPGTGTGYDSTGYLSAPGNDIMSASIGVGTAYEGTTAMSTGILSLEVDVSGNLRVKPQVGSSAPYGIGLGTFDATGRLGAYYNNDTLLQQMLTHAASSLWFPIFDSPSSPTTGNAYAVAIHRLRFGTAGAPLTGPNQDVRQDLDFEGSYESNKGFAVSLYRFAAP